MTWSSILSCEQHLAQSKPVPQSCLIPEGGFSIRERNHGRRTVAVSFGYARAKLKFGVRRQASEDIHSAASSELFFKFFLRVDESGKKTCGEQVLNVSAKTQAMYAALAYLKLMGGRTQGRTILPPANAAPPEAVPANSCRSGTTMLYQRRLVRDAYHVG